VFDDEPLEHLGECLSFRFVADFLGGIGVASELGELV
jgi:hypothetical protein